MAEIDPLAAALDPIRERVQKASRGPWTFEREHHHDMDGDPFSIPMVTGPDGQDVILSGNIGDSGPDLQFAAHARTDIPRLLAAVEKACSFHQRFPLYGNASTDDEPGACPHDPDHGLHFEPAEEPGEWLCQGRHEGAVCSTCTDGPGGERLPWPCDEYAAILAALTGRTVADVLVILREEGAANA